MKSYSKYYPQLGGMFVFIAFLFLSGCGGGGGSDSSNDAPSASVLSVQADAGNIIGIRVGETANLDGSASSTTLSSPLTYSWSFTHKPQASKTAVLINADTAHPSFTPDVVGTYTVQLVVSADGINSKRAIALVEASISGNVSGDVRVHTSFSSQCSNCHDGRFSDANVNPGLILAKTGSHAGTSNMCQACHTTFGFNIIRYADHQEVFGNCSSCHNGTNATGKSSSHLTTESECDVCHNTTSFLTLDTNGNYDHTGITDGCVRCHNGKTAIGINHNPDTFDKSNNDCVFCHNTTTFTDAFPDHNAILNNVDLGNQKCTDCHGSTAQGTKLDHPVTAPIDCGTCHGIKQFSLGGVFNHRVDASIVRCDVCHTDNNSINAIGMGAFVGHLDPVGEDCGTCHGVGGGTFTNAVIDHSSSIVTTARCDSCHAGAGTATKKSATHIITQITPTVVDCNACHTPGNFKTGTFNHSTNNIGTLVCSDCHNDTNTAGKNVNHIPTTDECGVCHTTDTFIGATVDHSTITNNCSSCHDGNISKGKSLNHLSTVRDCATCHSTLTPLTFVGGTYDHADPGISTNCSSCHDGVTAINKSSKVDHIPAKKECSECHSDTTIPGGFANSIFRTDVHPKQLNGCEGCHTTKYLSAKISLLKEGSTNHVPTSQDCHLCHSNTSFTDIAQFTHEGISGGCESCHDGSYYSIGAGPKAKGKTNPIPSTTHTLTTSDCGSCHAIGKGFTDGKFDHTGIVSNCSSCHDGPAPTAPTKNIGHVTTAQDCSICHVPGTFKTAVFNHNQIESDCVSCHENPNATATVKPDLGHVVTTDDCYVCHNKNQFAGATYDHTGINKGCASCHDGVIALGKNGTHVPTNKDCSVCHKTTGMLPATFDHAGIVGSCDSCHNGVFARDKNIGHVATAQDCGVCHTVPANVVIANGPTNEFIPATYDHGSIQNTTRCDSCHGVTAKGKDAKINPAHGDTTADCRVCHLSTASFKGAKWVHDSSTVGNCLACHGSGGVATQQPASGKNGHFDTTVQCDSCHTSNNWIPANTFDHCDGQPTSNVGTCSSSVYPGNHRTTLSCLKCHANNSQAVTYSTPFDKANPQNTLKPFCAGCHRDRFSSESDHIGGKNGTVFQNRNCAGSGCHKVSDSGF